MAGPPFTGLETALAGIAAGEPTGLVFYAVAEPPHTERVAIRRLTAPSITTSLVLPSGQRPPGLRHLLAAAQAAARFWHRQPTSPHPP